MSPDPCPAARAVPASSGPPRNSALQGLATPLSEKSASPRASSVLFLLPNPNLSTLQAFPCFLLVGAPIVHPDPDHQGCAHQSSASQITMTAPSTLLPAMRRALPSRPQVRNSLPPP